MPVEMAVWKLGDRPERVAPTRLDSERMLEDAIVGDLSLISEGLLLLGRQVATASGNFVDLLAIDEAGTVHVIELKRNRTPRDVVAQVLDYASWVQHLGYDDVAEIYRRNHADEEFEAAFDTAFGSPPPEELNRAHRMVIVASELDPATERIIEYLAESHGVPVNAVFFRHFKDGGSSFLMRSWFISPEEAEARAESAKPQSRREAWNGRDFYVSFGADEFRNWDDARRFGFVSGGGGAWYSKPLRLLQPGVRVFVHIPKAGYVGVGTVIDPVVPRRDFAVDVDGERVLLSEAPLEASRRYDHADDLEKCEYFVRIDWIKSVPRAEAHWEKGLFANQLTTCRLRNRFTIERVSQYFGVAE